MPPHPALLAAGVLTVWVAILALPMLNGSFLASAASDQYATGYAFRAWGAEQWRVTGHIPLWNPELFGGLPFVAAMHGDIFYPTAWLRLILPTHVAMNVGFVVHYVLAGVGTYWFLRLLRVSWTGAVAGGVAYQLSGVVASLVNPGHDGKLFVTSLLPLALISLIYALRDRRWRGYPLLALSVGLALLSPHAQMTYYFLIVAGLFALYLTFEVRAEPRGARMGRLGVAFVAVLLGFGIAMVQILPFYHYLPFSPRAEGYFGYEGSVSWAIPWEHVPEFFLARFVGTSTEGTYWGSNFAKLHSEYLGLPVVALAVLGAMVRERRRAVVWLGAIGLLFLLIGLGGATPFYRVWWTVMPFVKQTRAPGMAFYVVAFVVAALCAFGVERLERGEGRGHAKIWLIASGVVALLAVGGVFGAVAESAARSFERAQNRGFVAAAAAAGPAIRWGAFGSAAALGLVGAVSWGFLAKRWSVAVWGAGVLLVIGGDLWWNARGFWNYSRAPEELYGPDEITDYLRAQTLPYRVFAMAEVYGGSSLMAFDIPQLFGHHGNELHAFDELMGGKNVWRNFQKNPYHMWDLFAVRYLVVGSGVDSVPGFRKVLSAVPTSSGGNASLFERETPVRYARLVPVASKAAQDETVVATVADGRFPTDRVVLLGPDSPLDPGPLPEVLPGPIEGVRATVSDWMPGHMVVTIEPSAPQESYLLIAENHYPDWRATVDGRSVATARGDGSLLTVPVSAGARQVELTFVSDDYLTGKYVSFVSLAVVALGLIGPVAWRSRRRE